MKLASSLETMQVNCEWLNMQKAFIDAAIALVNLHHDNAIYHGGLSMSSVTYSGLTDHAYFLDWAFSCTADTIKSRISNPSKYYFKTTRLSTFEDLKFADLLALSLIYADMIAVQREHRTKPSEVLRKEYKSRSSSEWNDYITRTKLVGVKILDKLVINLAKNSQK